MPTLSSSWTNTFPPKPAFTENDVPDLDHKVYLVTGANAGLGKELAQMLYAKHAKVYIAARSSEKAAAAISAIQAAAPSSRGALVFLPLDLADLSTIKAATQRFLAAETQLHVLWNNAGVMTPDSGPLTRTPQGLELNLGVNCVGAMLLTKLLTPILAATAAVSPPDTVRVVWLASFGTEMFAAKDIGVDLDVIAYTQEKKGEKVPPGTARYGISKAGVWALAVELGRRYGIVSVPLNPGNLRTELFRDQAGAFRLMTRAIGYPVRYGALSQLYAGLAPDVTAEGLEGNWVIPFGRIYPIRKDLVKATKTVAEGGTGGTHDFWEWCEEQVRPYL